MNYRLGKKYRLKSRQEISRVFDGGKRKSDRLLTLFGLSTEAAITRFAVAVSVKHGNAVKRNRIKRLCREAFRLSKGQLPAGWDLVMLPRVGADIDLHNLQQSLVMLANKLSGRE